MTHIYFIRHSLKDRHSSLEDTPLSEEGKDLASQLPSFFSDIKIDKIYSSPYARSVDTVRPIALAKNLPLTTLDDLKERVVGLKDPTVTNFTSKQWEDPTFKFPTGESLEDVEGRIVSLIKSLLKNGDQHLIIGGHSTAFAVLFHHLTNGSFNYHDYLAMPSPGIYLGSFEGDTLASLTPLTLTKKLTP